MKKNIVRILSLCLCLAFMLGAFAGCGGDPDTGSLSAGGAGLGLETKSVAGAQAPESSSGSGSEAASASGTAAEGSIFQKVWHSGEKFSDIEYEHYDYADFQTLADRIYKFASSGGSAEKFQVADAHIVNELYYIYTMYTLADIQYMQDATDENSQECIYITQVYSDASNEYWAAMSAMANSEYSELMENCYADWQIEQFAAYDGSGYAQEENDLIMRETGLVQRYYSLIAQDEPDYDQIGQIYVELVELRRDQAELYGYDSYAEYCYDSVYSRDYSPEEAQKLWSLAKEYFCPLADELYFELISDSYWPGDVDYSPEAILDAMDEVLPEISPELYEAFRFMLDRGLYDIADEPGKQEMGFTTRLYYQNEPFIFNKPGNSFLDYTTMFHEFGHFANAYYTESDLLFGISDNDICELQSQGLEVLALNFYDRIFGDRAGEYIAKNVLLNLLYSVVDGCMYDEFQQRVFMEESLSPERVKEIYAQVYEDYGYVAYDGYDLEWADVQHNFEFPFYYVSYAVSAVPALELYAMMQDSFDAAAEKYLAVSAMDTELYYFSEAMDEVGFGRVFDEATAREVSDALSIY